MKPHILIFGFSLLFLTVVTPNIVYSTVICPKGYTAGFLGCYYVKDMIVPSGYIPSSLSCDNPNDVVARVSNIQNYEMVTKPFYDEILGGNSTVVNGYVVGYYTDDNGVTHLKYICYTSLGIYPRENYSIRDYIKEHTSEVYDVTQGIELLSLYIGVLFIAGILGRGIGMGLATWAYTILLLLLQKTGLAMIPDVIVYIALATSSVLSILIALSIYSRVG